jgi:hypothetical protein
VNYGDIEGVWTFLYYSYTTQLKRAVGFIRYGAEADTNRIQFDVDHPVPAFLRFVLGGMNLGRYPAFNGLFRNIIFGVGKGSFLDTPTDIARKLDEQKPLPATNWNRIVSVKVNDDPVGFKKEDKSKLVVAGTGPNSFPNEYAFSGWFKWV